MKVVSRGAPPNKPLKLTAAGFCRACDLGQSESW